MNDKERQRETTNCNETQQMTMQDFEWARITTDVNDWQQMTVNVTFKTKKITNGNRLTRNYNESQRIIKTITNDNTLQWMTTSDH